METMTLELQTPERKLALELVDEAQGFPSLLYSMNYMYMPGWLLERWKAKNPDRVHELQNLKAEDFQNVHLPGIMVEVCRHLKQERGEDYVCKGSDFFCNMAPRAVESRLREIAEKEKK